MLLVYGNSVAGVLVSNHFVPGYGDFQKSAV